MTATSWPELWEEFDCGWRELWFNQCIEPPGWVLADETLAGPNSVGSNTNARSTDD